MSHPLKKHNISKNIEAIFIEINSTPGTKGYKKATKENIAKDVLATFMDRTTWLKTKPFTSIYNKEKR